MITTVATNQLISLLNEHRVQFPIKFGCYKPTGNGIVKPTPIPVANPLKVLDESSDQRMSVKKYQIIHNECEFSEEGYVCWNF
jgi:hypothetical protein